jgi:hypothetical protein
MNAPPKAAIVSSAVENALVPRNGAITDAAAQPDARPIPPKRTAKEITASRLRILNASSPKADFSQKGDERYSFFSFEASLVACSSTTEAAVSKNPTLLSHSDHSCN